MCTVLDVHIAESVCGNVLRNCVRALALIVRPSERSTDLIRLCLLLSTLHPRVVLSRPAQHLRALRFVGCASSSISLEMRVL
jgi:hypothetical protein